MENLEFDLEEAFQEILARRQTQGSLSKDEFIDLVEEVLEEKREEGLLDDDFQYKQAQETLASRWEEVAEEKGVLYDEDPDERDSGSGA